MNRYIVPLEQLLLPFVQQRFEQVQLEVEHNFEDYPTYKQHYDLYHDKISHLKAANPESSDEIEHLVNALHLYYSDLANEAYRQGAKDWMAMFFSAKCTHGRCPSTMEE